MLDYDKILEELGAQKEIKEQIIQNLEKGFLPARIITQYSGIYQASVDIQTTVRAIISGGFKKNISSRADIPVVGDWVLLDCKYKDKKVITKLIPRHSLISRHHPYKGEQPLAANIDILFITISADPVNFDTEKIKNYLSIKKTKNITTYIILNKIDLSDKSPEFLKEKIEKETFFPASFIIALDSINIKGYDELKTKLLPFKTSTFIGPSGAGKSTIINNLYGKKILKTTPVSLKTMKGRHTTTTRKIIILSNNHIVIDTPGISMTSNENLIKFEKILEHEGRCKFSDCKHISEPGCFIRDMVDKGMIEKKIYTEYVKFIRSEKI